MNRGPSASYPAVFFAAASLALLYLSGHPVPKPDLSPFQAAFLGLYAMLLGYVGVPLPGLGQANLSMMGNLVLASLLPPPSAAGIAFLAAPFRPPLRPERELFNRTQLALATLAAAFAAERWGFLPATLLYVLVNTGSILLLARRLGMDPGRFFRESLLPFIPGYLGLSPLAFLAGQLYLRPVVGPSGEVDLLIMSLPALYVYSVWSHRLRLIRAVQAALASVVRFLEAKDPYTAHHSERVAAIALDLGRALGLSPGQMEALEKAARFHDVGKVAVPDSVLNKEGPLAPEEWERMRRHPEISVALLEPLREHMAAAFPAILHHHERLDGSGYPAGLRGEEIPLLARVLAVADAYEAMTSDRPYRRGLDPEEALRRLKEEAGRQFDPEVVAAFERVLAENPAWKDKGFWRRTLA